MVGCLYPPSTWTILRRKLGRSSMFSASPPKDLNCSKIVVRKKDMVDKRGNYIWFCYRHKKTVYVRRDYKTLMGKTNVLVISYYMQLFWHPARTG